MGLASLWLWVPVLDGAVRAGGLVVWPCVGWGHLSPGCGRLFHVPIYFCVKLTRLQRSYAQNGENRKTLVYGAGTTWLGFQSADDHC